MELKIEFDGDKWYVHQEGKETKEFTERAYALIYLNNLTVSMYLDKED